MDLTLYRVGASGRVALGPLAAGVEYYTAGKDPNGVVTLTPVKIVGPSQRAETAAPDDQADEDPADPAPFD